MPEDATNICIYYEVILDALDSSSTVLGNTNKAKKLVSADELTIEILGSGRKKVAIPSFELSYDNAYMLRCNKSSIVYVIYTLPNTSMNDNILYAHELCESLFVNTNGITNSYTNLLYAEGIDMRGSKITTLPAYGFSGHTELKKVWLPEMLETLNAWFSGCTGIEELHFTSEVPPTMSATVRNIIPATCKIYVPAGTLDAYTSSSNYPDPATYTYIEE